METNPIPAVTRPNQTQFDRFSPFWLGLGMGFPQFQNTGMGFPQFQNTGMGRVTGIYVPTPNPYPNPSQMQKIILCWYVMLFCLIIVMLIKTIIDI